MKVKTCPARIKAAGTQDGTDDGVFEAIVATWDIDSVGDKITRGAFTDTLAAWDKSGDPIPVLWSHMSHDPDYHIGYVEAVEERDEGLWVKARLDLDEPKSAKIYKLLKGRRVRQFSFAYDVAEGGYVEEKDDGDGGYFELRRLRLYEVGPTLIGANQATELLTVKSAISSHETATDSGEWDGPANEANLSNDAGADTYRQAYAWADPDGDPDAKATYKFIHHKVSSNGAVGAASVQACITGIAVLNGARQGTTIPDDDRQGVYNHLARHLRDADVEPAELKSAAESTETSAPEAGGYDEETALAALAKIVDGAAELKAALGNEEETETEPRDEPKATPAAPPAPNPRSHGGHGFAPARPGTASIRLHHDLGALCAEVDDVLRSNTHERQDQASR